MADLTKLNGYALTAPVDAGEVGATKVAAYALTAPVDAGEVGATKMVAYVLQDTAGTPGSQQPRMIIVT